MTNAEAVEILKDYHESRTRFNEIIGELDDEFCDALGLAISALEKQVGEKPKEDGLMGVHIPVCANCKNPLMFISEKARSDFCPKCGQKLDWSDEWKENNDEI